ncbi:casein kinase II beta subunit [Atractiella rhizophila]|nr:casein kinase II beta subunit [Atractiella rhizophila]
MLGSGPAAFPPFVAIISKALDQIKQKRLSYLRKGFYKEALEMILDVEPEEESLKIPDVSILESSAELLYGLIHQRFVVTRQGLQAMHEKYQSGHFGACPRVYCNGWKVVPCGRSDLPGVDTVKLYCSNCIDTYTPPSSRFNAVDGAFFGTTFPHLFFQTYKELQPGIVGVYLKGGRDKDASIGANGGPAGAGGVGTDGEEETTVMTSSARIYTPKIYGFRVSERAKSGPRMQWLRMRPRREEELDDVDERGEWKEGRGINRFEAGRRKKAGIAGNEEEEEEEGEGERREKKNVKTLPTKFKGATTTAVAGTAENGAKKRK